jgi:hypothetical protein
MLTILPQENLLSSLKIIYKSKYYLTMPILTLNSPVSVNNPQMLGKNQERSLKEYVMQMKMMHAFLQEQELQMQ